jgi:GT2 family glycosyltransferase
MVIPVRASVIVPTFRRSEKLCACLRALARQSAHPRDFDVHIAIDGREPRTVEAAAGAWRQAGADPARLVVSEAEQAGPCAARNRAIRAAAGEALIFFNDDVTPAPGCVAEHLAAQNARPAIYAGDSPWRVRSPDSLFAQLVRETSMVFFHHRMRGHTDPDHDWGYRHAWLLNLSIPAKAVRDCGGLRIIQRTYGRDDDELAFRLTREHALPVLFRPGAVAVHDHAMTPRAYLRREYELGYGAPAFALGAPECARDLFGRDILCPAERSDANGLLARYRDAAAELLPWFVSLAQQPPARSASDALWNAHYQRHLPLKRWMWRRGLVDAFDGRVVHADEALDSLAIAVAA